MKNLIVLVVLLLGFTNCDESEVISPQTDLMMASTFGSKMSKNDINISDMYGRSSCSQNLNFTVKLQTLSGVNINPANVQPSTQYKIIVTYTAPYVCCANVAYWTKYGVGFTNSGNDAINGNTTIRITTNPVLPPFGITGVVGPTDCSGGQSSVDDAIIKLIE